MKGFFFMSSIEIFGKYILLTVIVSELVFESGELNYLLKFSDILSIYRFHLNYWYLGCRSRGPIFNLLTLMIQCTRNTSPECHSMHFLYYPIAFSITTYSNYILCHAYLLSQKNSKRAQKVAEFLFLMGIPHRSI